MDEEKESNFKITDRRKFNADGTPREQPDEETSSVSASVEQPPVKAANDASKVISFPGKGEKEPEPVEKEPKTESNAAAREASDAAERSYNQASGGRPSRLPEASFLGLTNMLAVEAAMHLGLIKSPGVDEDAVDLEAARHLIDMLGILQKKSSGNLTAEEDNMLDNVLADLRMQFVAISKKR